MKIMKIKVTGLKLLKNKLEIDFYAKQRVSSEKNEMLTNIFSNTNTNIYINNVISFVGINASGKTTTLKVISFVLEMLKNKPINTINCKDILLDLDEKDEACFEVYFVSNDKELVKLKTVVKVEEKTEQIELESKYVISNEKIWTKSLTSVRSKKDLFNFKGNLIERNSNEEYLMDDVSIIISYNKKHGEKLFAIDLIDFTNYNGLATLSYLPKSLVRFLDPTIEYINFKSLDKNDSKIEICLKFFEKEEIILNSKKELSKYLSSGTIKVINVFTMAFVAIGAGGYIIIDELENHFNKEIVSTLIKFFMDSEINKKGAVMIFSTHYVELLDIFDRNDNIFVVKNKNGILVENLSDLLKRNDVKKSEIFQSGYLDGTSPSYEAYIELKRVITEPLVFGEV